MHGNKDNITERKPCQGFVKLPAGKTIVPWEQMGEDWIDGFMHRNKANCTRFLLPVHTELTSIRYFVQ